MKKERFLIGISLVLSLVACEKEDADRAPDVNYNPVIRPENFSLTAENPWFPLIPGKKYSYMGQTPDGTETSVVTITGDLKLISGISCVVVHDEVFLEGTLIEDTYDWFSLDNDGNVWYFGEDVSNYENGVFQDREGSFETGVDGAKPGIMMHMLPVPEMPYRQEYYFGVAEDWGKLVATSLTVTTPYGTFDDCIKTEDWNALEPDAPVEFKYYAPGVGMVREEIDGTGEVLELISIE